MSNGDDDFDDCGDDYHGGPTEAGDCSHPPPMARRDYDDVV